MSQVEWTKESATPLKLEAEIISTSAVPAQGLSTYSDGVGGAVVMHAEPLSEGETQELEQALAVHVPEAAEPVNYLEFVGAPAGAYPAVQAQGPDDAIGIKFRPKLLGGSDVSLDILLIGDEITLQFVGGLGARFINVDNFFSFDQQINCAANVVALRLLSNVATGDSPISCDSTTRCDNLNADMLDDLHATAFALTDHSHAGTYEPAGTCATHAALTETHGATGAIVGTTNTQTLTGKTLTSPILTTPEINNLAGTFQYILTPTAIAADRIITLPLLTGSDVFVFEAHTQTLTNKTLTTPTINDPVITIYDRDNLNFGTDSDCQIAWETAGNDCLQIGVTCGAAAGSGYVILCEKADLGNANRSPTATSVDPVFRVYSADAAAATDYIQLLHNGSNPRIEWGLPAENLIFACNTATNTNVEFANMGVCIWNENTIGWLTLYTHHATATYGGELYFARSKGTHASPTTLASGDEVGGVSFSGYSNAYYERANIVCEVDGSVSGTTVPMRLVFNTGTTAAGESLRIKSDKNILIASSNQLQFRGTGNYINSPGTTSLQIVAGLTMTLYSGSYKGIEMGNNDVEAMLGFFGKTPLVGRSSAYTVTNRTTDRTYNCDSTTTAELADVLGTLIYDLQQTGLIG